MIKEEVNIHLLFDDNNTLEKPSSIKTTHDPEWDQIIAELSQHCRANGLKARTTLKGGSLIIKERRR